MHQQRGGSKEMEEIAPFCSALVSSYQEKLRVGRVQSGKGKALKRPYFGFQHLKGAYEQEGD